MMLAFAEVDRQGVELRAGLGEQDVRHQRAGDRAVGEGEFHLENFLYGQWWERRNAKWARRCAHAMLR